MRGTISKLMATTAIGAIGNSTVRLEGPSSVRREAREAMQWSFLFAVLSQREPALTDKYLHAFLAGAKYGMVLGPIPAMADVREESE